MSKKTKKRTRTLPTFKRCPVCRHPIPRLPGNNRANDLTMHIALKHPALHERLKLIGMDAPSDPILYPDNTTDEAS